MKLIVALCKFETRLKMNLQEIGWYEMNVD